MKKYLLILFLFLNQNFAMATDWTSSAVGAWVFNEGTGTTVDDVSPNSNTCTLNGNAAWSTTVPNSNVRYSISFDGTDDYLSCGTSDTFNLTGSFTVMAWLKLTGYGESSNGRWLNRGNATNTTGWGFAASNTLSGYTNVPYMVIYGATNFSNPASNTLPTGSWVHVAAVVSSGSSVAWYINGALSTGDTTITSLVGQTGATLYIGQRSDGLREFNGLIAEVGIFNTALSARDILDIYNNGIRGGHKNVINNATINKATIK